MTDLRRRLLGEALGTFLLVGLGTGTVASSVLLGRPGSPAAVAALWGLAVVAAIHVSAPHSGAHLNPAVSLATALWRPREFPRRLLAPYGAAQLLGAILAGGAVLAAFGPALRSFEAHEGIVRGEPGSERSAMVFGEYFPNPAAAVAPGTAAAGIAPVEAALAEAAGTAILVFVAFAVGAARGPRVRRAGPWIVGGTVAAIILVLAPATQAGLNPARDLGPRLVAFAAGFGPVALPGPHGGFWVYVVGPLAGGVLGGFVHERAFARRQA